MLPNLTTIIMNTDFDQVYDHRLLLNDLFELVAGDKEAFLHEMDTRQLQGNE